MASAAQGSTLAGAHVARRSPADALSSVPSSTSDSRGVREDRGVREVRSSEAEVKPAPTPPMGAGHSFVLTDPATLQWKCSGCGAIAFTEPKTRVITGCVCLFCRPCGKPIVPVKP